MDSDLERLRFLLAALKESEISPVSERRWPRRKAEPGD
jgi:hypothetical protein